MYCSVRIADISVHMFVPEYIFSIQIERNASKQRNFIQRFVGYYEAAGRDTGITSILIFTILVIPVL